MFYKTVYLTKRYQLTFKVFSMIFIHKTEPSIIKSLFLVTIRFCHHFTTLSSYHLPAKHHFLTHGLSWTVIGYPIINHFLTHGLSWTILDYHRLSL